MKISQNDIIFKYYEDEPYNEYRISYFGWESKSQALAFDNYISGYKFAADSIYESFKIASIDGRIDIQDTICFPLCFIYRHIVELYLKLFYIKYLKQSDVDLKCFINHNGHRIKTLWNYIRPEIERLLTRAGSDVNLFAIDHYMIEIDTFDERSFNFRFPIKNDIKMVHNGCKILDIPIMNERMNAFLSYLEKVRKDIHIQLEKFPIEESKVNCINTVYIKSRESFIEILNIYKGDKQNPEDTDNDLLDSLFYGTYDTPIRNITINLDHNQKVLLLLLILSGKDLVYDSCILAVDPKERRKDFYKLLISNIQDVHIDFNIEPNILFQNYFNDKVCCINPNLGYKFLMLAINEMDKCFDK